jgi:putative flippase GtrA
MRRMKNIINNSTPRSGIVQVALFLAAGAVNTVFGYGIYYLLLFAGLVYLLAYTVSTILGIAFSYFMYSRFVFKDKGATKAIKFFILYGLNYVLGLGLLRLLVGAGVDPRLAGAINILVISASSFFAQKTMIFIRRNR